MRIKPGMKLFFKSVPERLRGLELEISGVIAKEVSMNFGSYLFKIKEDPYVWFWGSEVHPYMSHTKLGRILYK